MTDETRNAESRSDPGIEVDTSCEACTCPGWLNTQGDDECINFRFGTVRCGHGRADHRSGTEGTETKGTVQAVVKRRGGNPPQWVTYGEVTVGPGEVKTIGGGAAGPAITIIGVAGGARFQSGSALNIILKVSGTNSWQFPLAGRDYLALVY